MSASQFPPLQSRPSTKHCTNCSTLMSLYSLPGHYGPSVDIDVCHACNALWFDQWESSQLSPDGTVALFQLINERGGTSSSAASKFGEGLRCVTCGSGMRLTNDRVKNTRFVYQACPQGHGRLTTFYNFLAEKQFVRELTRQERARLATSVQQIKCAGCGAAVNIGKTDACEYCRAPVSVFDREAAKKAIDHYLQQRQQQVPMQAPGGSKHQDYSGTGAGGFGYGGVELAADILFALGRAASRGVGGLGAAGARAVPAATGVGVGSVFADSGDAATGGLLESIRAGGNAANALPNAMHELPSATDALFGSGLGGGLGSDLAASLPQSLALLPDTASLLPTATDALFGSGASVAADTAGGFMGEFGNVFADSAGSAIADTASSMAVDLGGGALAGIGDAATSAGEGIVDLVGDGLGSLLGSLFD